MNTSQVRTRAMAVEATISWSGMTVFRMSRWLRLVVALLLLATILGVVSARPVWAAEEVPFRGTFVTSTHAAVPCGPMTFCIELAGSGAATHLGWTELLKNSVSTRTTESCPGGAINTYMADITLTAASGDTITMSGSGTVCEGPGGVTATGTYTITGGTGRFSGASGTIEESLERVGANVYVILAGTISPPGSLKH